MRIRLSRHISFSLFLFVFMVFSGSLLAQEEQEENDKLTQYQEEVKQMVSFLEYSMNVLGDPAYSAKEKDVIINESYNKIFANEKVQIEDDLDDNRDVVTNKDVQAYLKDVDFFFKQVTFEFNIIDIDHSQTQDGKLFFTVKMMRSLKGITVENDSMNSDKERYVEVNVDEENKDLKIASIYTTRLSRDQELTFWWAGLSNEWKTLLGVDIDIREGLRLNEIQEFSDSTFIVDGQEMTDSIKIINYVKQAAGKTELNLSGSYLIQNLKPLDQLKDLTYLDISGSAIKDIFPIRNITTLTHLNCSNTMIEDLNPLRYSKSLKELYISNTPVSSIMVIENFDNLEVLHLEQTVIDSLPSIDRLVQLKELNCSSSNMQKLDSIKYLTALEVLDCSNTAISDLSPISGLDNLKNLNIAQTSIVDLEPIGAISSLEELHIEKTAIDQLDGLKQLKNLKIIWADDSEIEMDDFISFSSVHPEVDIVFMSVELDGFWNDLDENWRSYFNDRLQFGDSISSIDLHKFLHVKSIDISNNSTLGDLAPLKYTPLLESLDFSGATISDIEPLQATTKLKRINGANSQVTDLSPLANLIELQYINFENTAVVDISSLAELKALDTLIFNQTSVKGISVLNEINSFKVAYFDDTQVGDDEVLSLDFDENSSVLVYKSEKLQSWWGNMDDKWQDIFINTQSISKRPTTEELHQLVASKELEASGTSLKTLNPISEFIRLESLSFSETRISSLSPLSGLQKIKVLKCPRNPISEIEPLSSLNTLIEIDLNNTQISSLKPLASLTGLKKLTFSGTNVKDLSPVSVMINLEALNFSKTKVKQIKALDNISSLKNLECYNNKISDKKIEEFRLKNPDCEVVFY